MVNSVQRTPTLTADSGLTSGSTQQVDEYTVVDVTIENKGTTPLLVNPLFLEIVGFGGYERRPPGLFPAQRHIHARLLKQSEAVELASGPFHL